VRAGTHDFAGRLHFRPENRIARELDEREHRLLHREVRRHDLLDDALLGSDCPAMQRAAILASGRPVAFDTNGTVRDARGFTSST
jgi:hypothetical protein